MIVRPAARLPGGAVPALDARRRYGLADLSVPARHQHTSPL